MRNTTTRLWKKFQQSLAKNSMSRHKIPHENKMLKAELFTLIRATNPVPVYKTDILAEEKGNTCLRLPVGH